MTQELRGGTGWQLSSSKRQEDLCEFKASLVYRVSSRISSKATEKPCLKKPKATTTTKPKKARLIFLFGMVF